MIYIDGLLRFNLLKSYQTLQINLIDDEFSVY